MRNKTKRNRNRKVENYAIRNPSMFCLKNFSLCFVEYYSMSNPPVKVKGKFIVSAWDSLKIWILFNLPERNSLNGRLLNLQEFF